MMHNTRTDDLELFFDLIKHGPPHERMDTPLKIVVPAFIISELKTAFIMGFLYLHSISADRFGGFHDSDGVGDDDDAPGGRFHTLQVAVVRTG